MWPGGSDRMSSKYRLVANQVSERNRVGHRLQIETRCEPSVPQDRLDLGREEKRLRIAETRHIQRLDAERIAREQQAAAVENGKREHAVELAYQIIA